MDLNKIQQPFLNHFPGEDSFNPMQRQTPGKLYSLVKPAGFPSAKVLHFNEKLSEEIGLGTIKNQTDNDFLNSNIEEIPNIRTYATAYSGHQFGNWADQLGDGRAIFAGEIQHQCNKTELQWKGAGATPYSRHADGRAVLRSTVREYLMSEAMHHLKIPTTRALSLSWSGEDVVRDIMYSGHPKAEKGALMMRTAESFLRFGHFEFLSSTKNYDLLKRLADFTIQNYYPKISSESKFKYIEFFNEISQRTADLMVEWYRVGFVHGVMNTDNMSALGLTIDYGPFAMLEYYDLSFTSNTTDLPGRRYAFGEQAKIAQWNLWQLANALYPLIGDAEPMQETLNNFSDYFWQKHDEMLCRKFGFDKLLKEDEAFFNYWQKMMQALKIDYALFFQKLESKEDFDWQVLSEISYRNIDSSEFIQFQEFLKLYEDRLKLNSISPEESQRLMEKSNPKFILRNYLLFECIEQLNEGKMNMFEKLWDALQKPYENLFPEFKKKRPSKYDEVAGCSMLSCSS